MPLDRLSSGVAAAGVVAGPVAGVVAGQVNAVAINHASGIV
jgi:hypothetical protein